MAERIYDQTVGQLAGVSVATTGKGNITNDGLQAFAQMVVSASGSPISSTAGTGNLVSVTGATVTNGTISFSAAAQFVVIDTQGFEGAGFTISGFGTATLQVQWSNLTGSGFVAGSVTNVGTGVAATSITASGQYLAAAGGRYMKIITTAFTSGPILVTPVLMAGGGVSSSSGGGGAVTIADGADVALGATTDTAAASGNVDATLLAVEKAILNAAIDTTPVAVDGGTAADAALTLPPVTIGGLAKSANPTAVSDGDVVNERYDLTGRAVIVPHQARALQSDTAITITASTAAADLLAAGAAGVFNDILSVTLINTSATGTVVQILNADGATVRWTGYCPPTDMRGIVFPVPLKNAAAAAKWMAKTVTSVSSVTITIQYAINVA